MTQTLTNSIISGRVAHAFLFCGVRGVGKTTVARILAKALNCSGRNEGYAEPCGECQSCTEINQGISVDVQEIDGASHTSVENIRDINENIKYPPVSSPNKIIIIDEVHMISINAFNALLKTLEEPPAHVKFIFATTESHKVPATINSRCQRFNFRALTVDDLTNGMSEILKKENIKASEEALAIITLEAQGSFRDGLSLLDQVISFSSGHIEANVVMDILGLGGRNSLGKIMEAVLERSPGQCIEILRQLFHEGASPEQLCSDLIKYIRNLIIVKAVPQDSRPGGMLDATPSQLEEMQKLASQGSLEEFQNFFSLAMKGEEETRRSQTPWIALEMTVLKMASAPKLTDLSALIDMIKSGSFKAGKQTPAALRSPERKPDKKPDQGPQKKPDEEKKTAQRGTTTDASRSPESAESSIDSPKAGPTRGRFLIEEVRPIPEGSNDEIWDAIKDRIKNEIDSPMLITVIEHGSLISFGPKKVEVGFTRSIYGDQFREKLENSHELRSIFSDIFSDAQVQVLTLAERTPMNTKDPYAAPDDGQSDLKRAMKQEAMDHPITRAVLKEFQGSSVEDIKIIK